MLIEVTMQRIKSLLRSTGLVGCSVASVLMFLVSCHYQQPLFGSSEIATASVREAPQAKESIEEIFRDKPQVIEAWRRFNEKGNYRMARFSDFQFSKAAIGRMSGYDNLWREKLDQPYIFGDITRLGRSSDLAMIVIDQATEDPNRKFGLIVFNANADRSLSAAKWGLRDHSLSTTKLGWAGNWPAVFKYGPDGHLERLFINWNPHTKTYSIDKEQIGVGARN